MTSSVPPKNVLLLLCEGAELSEAAAFVDVFGWSTSYGTVPVTVTTASTNGSEVVCTFGVRVHVDRRCADLDAAHFDALAIPGGFESFGFYADAYSPPVQTLIHQFVVLGKPVAAVCVGALPLAKTGSLRGRRATTYHLMEGRRRKQLAELGAIVVDEMVVEDGPFITSTSPATAMEVALRLLARVTGAENANAVRNLIGTWRSSAWWAKPSGAGPPCRPARVTMPDNKSEVRRGIVCQRWSGLAQPYDYFGSPTHSTAHQQEEESLWSGGDS